MKVVVYVEGPSDKLALEKFLEALIDKGSKRGVGIRFSPQNGKAPILNDVPRKAAEILRQHPTASRYGPNSPWRPFSDPGKT